MTPEKAEEILAEINKPGSDLNLKYLRWQANKMTEMLGDIMYFLSAPDQCTGKLANVPGSGEDSACAMLGYSLGRSHSVTELLTLNRLLPEVPAEPEENFINEEREQGE